MDSREALAVLVGVTLLVIAYILFIDYIEKSVGGNPYKN